MKKCFSSENNSLDPSVVLELSKLITMVRKNQARTVKASAIKSAITIKRTAGKACETVSKLRSEISQMAVPVAGTNLVFLYW